MTPGEIPTGRDGGGADVLVATIKALRQTGVGAHALRVGDRFPDFLLPDAEGRLVESAELTRVGPAVVTFYRGDWCSTCCDALLRLEVVAREIEAAGATLTAISPETAGRALAVKQRLGLGYRMLADVDHGLATACGLVFRAPKHYRGLLRREGGGSAGAAGQCILVPALAGDLRAGRLRNGPLGIS